MHHYTKTHNVDDTSIKLKERIAELKWTEPVIYKDTLYGS